MTEPKRGRPDRKPVTWNRVAVWVIVAAIGAYLVVTGIFGILAKG
ncbi:hypothetical protein ACFFGH_22200 [Lysobacter korlensis]|uniref:Cyanide insensitive terminal oxidase, subunit III n=1 Tax=Lysobacter korlensis TaxID=553636 RepID=A0ABV6RUA6_9GAMM